MTALGEAAQTGGKRAAPSLNGQSPALSPWRATFVTLTENERLRGCIGSLEPRRPLIDDALANTAQAAFADPRFPPLKETELTGLRLDISILSHPRPIPAGSESELASALEPDRDGLILAVGKRRALFLPSVWRHLPDARAFVRHLMAKAGFETNRWPEGLEARRFRVESFGAPWRRVDSKEIATVTTTRRGPTLRQNATVFSVRRRSCAVAPAKWRIKKSVRGNHLTSRKSLALNNAPMPSYAMEPKNIRTFDSAKRNWGARKSAGACHVRLLVGDVWIASRP